MCFSSVFKGFEFEILYEVVGELSLDYIDILSITVDMNMSVSFEGITHVSACSHS